MVDGSTMKETMIAIGNYGSTTNNYRDTIYGTKSAADIIAEGSGVDNKKMEKGQRRSVNLLSDD